jgi:sterol desaturase/sphingolipid hydroxylase (fatty acid hydroxylase superfamily)
VTNVRLFVTLLFTVQAFFLIADGWTTWVESRRPRRDAIRLGAFVFASAAVYFVVQLTLSALLPDFPRLLAMFSFVAGAGPAEAGHDGPGPAAVALLVVLAFLVVTLVDYLVHRFILHRWLFVVHENHHLPTVVSNLMPGIVARPFVVIPNLLINAGSVIVLLMLVRVSGASYLVATFDSLILPLALVFSAILCASHSSFLRRYEAAERVCRAIGIVTPREHLVHHAAEIDGNYGNFTMIWDRLFGTYVPPPLATPVLGRRYDQDFLGSLTGGLLKLPRAMRDYFGVAAVCRIQLDTDRSDRHNVPQP